MANEQEVEDFLAHFGVLGMKWGQHKIRPEPEVAFRKKLKNGGELVVTVDPPIGLTKFLNKYSAKFRADSAKYHSFVLRDSLGKDVGNASFIQDTPSSLNLSWIYVKKQSRGNGYASATLQGVVNYAKDKGITKLKLEVPGNAPDALNIYSKLGFKTVKTTTDTKDDVWGGLTEMELTLPKKVLAHSEFNPEELFNYIVREIDLQIPNEESLLEQSSIVEQEVEEFLAHFGILGMKWGRHKAKEPGVTVGSSGSKQKETYSEKEKAVLAAVGANSQSQARLRGMYGPESMSASQKKVLAGVGIGALVVGGALLARFGGPKVLSKIAANSLKKKAAFKSAKDALWEQFANDAAKAAAKADPVKNKRMLSDALFDKNALADAKQIAFNKAGLKYKNHVFNAADNALPLRYASVGEKFIHKFDDAPMLQTKFERFMEKSNNLKINKQFGGFTKEDIAKLGTERVQLKAGAILKRVSTEKESMIHDSGFFAAFKDEDVTRYKAVLPAYWSQWGYANKAGFVVNLKAKVDISAPSPKETIDIFKSTFDDMVTMPKFNEWGQVLRGTKTTTIRQHFISKNALSPYATDDDIVEAAFADFSAGWMRQVAETDNTVKAFFAKVQAAGHNALVDLNDAGSIGDSPLRVLDGKMFSVDSHEVLSEGLIAAARENILAFAHALSKLNTISFNGIKRLVLNGR